MVNNQSRVINGQPIINDNDAAVKINLIEIENSKRIKAFRAEPAKGGLTVIGGKNGQGKTSVLRGIGLAALNALRSIGAESDG